MGPGSRRPPGLGRWWSGGAGPGWWPPPVRPPGTSQIQSDSNRSRTDLHKQKCIQDEGSTQRRNVGMAMHKAEGTHRMGGSAGALLSYWLTLCPRILGSQARVKKKIGGIQKKDG